MNMSAERQQSRIFLAILFCFGAIVALSWFSPHTFSALLTSVVIAYLVNPALKYIEKRNFDRFTALCLLYGLLFMVFFFASFFLIPYLGHQIDALSNALPLYLKNLQADAGWWESAMSGRYGAEEAIWLISRFEMITAKVLDYISGFGLTQLKKILFAGFNIILAPILVFFMLLYKQHAKDFIKRMFHHDERRHLIELGGEINRTLERFLIGMFFDLLIVGILTSIALALLGIEFPILNGLFAGFASAVPLLGVMLAVIPPALIGYANSGDPWIIPKVGAAYFIINVIIEGNLIKPLVMRHTLKLNPLAVIFAVMSLGELLGFWGVVLAIPAAAVFKICTGEMKLLLGVKGSEAE